LGRMGTPSSNLSVRNFRLRHNWQLLSNQFYLQY
jgi:hypothetical protein